jgi:hypothetical protein
LQAESPCPLIFEMLHCYQSSSFFSSLCQMVFFFSGRSKISQISTSNNKMEIFSHKFLVAKNFNFFIYFFEIPKLCKKFQ